MATFTESFTQADGNLGNGWADLSSFGGSNPIIQVASNIGTINRSASDGNGAQKAHGLAITGGQDWQVTFDMEGHLTTDAGGVSFLLINSSFTGLGFFLGNAVHVQEFTAGAHDNITNVGRTQRSNSVRITYENATNEAIVYLDGVNHASNTTTFVAGPICLVNLYDTGYPTTKATIDTIVLQDSIGGTSASANSVNALVTATAANPGFAGVLPVLRGVVSSGMRPG